MKKYLIPITLILFYSCGKSGGSKPTVPSVTTSSITNITDTSATSGGTVTKTGGDPITACGLLYDTSASLKTAQVLSTVPGNGSFSLTINGLPPGTTIYVQAYADNSVGRGLGNTVQFTTTTPPPNGYTVTTYAGNGVAQMTDGPVLQASFENPFGVAIDPTGVLYATEGSMTPNAGRIRRIGTDGNVTSLVTVGEAGLDILLDATGNIYDLDYNRTLYKISPAGVATPFAGNGVSTSTSVDGQGTAAGFSQPVSMDMDKNGNIFITQAKSIRKVTPSGYVSTLPLTATTNFLGIAVDQSDNIYVADGYNIEKTDTLGHMTVIAGSAQGLSNSILELRLDHNGNLIASDAGDYKIRLITPSGTVTTIAGTGVKGDKDGPGLQAMFNQPSGLAIDASNNIFVTDVGSNKIKKITHN